MDGVEGAIGDGFGNHSEKQNFFSRKDQPKEILSSFETQTIENDASQYIFATSHLPKGKSGDVCSMTILR